MAQYIDKDALVAEIEKYINRCNEKKRSYPVNTQVEAICDNKINAYNEVLSFLDTLEVKEVDLEDSIKETLAQNYVDYIFKRHDIDSESKEGQLIYYAYMHGMNQCLTQLRTQKGK